ncbi:hypothetical protein [Actinoplanes sp. L3-i22]|uniref:hypothetical protein n=1 Tax=Actinoplanes sp. L3-i22 TaxID=2836373 RepID=UPI001C754B87|nr:hypothetical protein [Actinoplanes sp. L3-i22]BCY11935.1 hypothetical protein L3i22_070230 [Actinoplanes sp. L3-i22]
MPKEHEELGVELYHLWLAGDKDLPVLAGQFDLARNDLHQSEQLDTCFRRPAEFHSGDTGPVYHSFRNLRETLAELLRDGGANLRAAGDALKLASQVYGEADERAAEELRAIRRDPGRGEF